MNRKLSYSWNNYCNQYGCQEIFPDFAFFDFFPYIETKNRRLSLKQILSVLFSHHNFLFTYIVGRYRLGKSYSNTVWRIGVIGNFY